MAFIDSNKEEEVEEQKVSQGENGTVAVSGSGVACVQDNVCTGSTYTVQLKLITPLSVRNGEVEFSMSLERKRGEGERGRERERGGEKEGERKREKEGERKNERERERMRERYIHRDKECFVPLYTQ